MMARAVASCLTGAVAGRARKPRRRRPRVHRSRQRATLVMSASLLVTVLTARHQSRCAVQIRNCAATCSRRSRSSTTLQQRSCRLQNGRYGRPAPTRSSFSKQASASRTRSVSATPTRSRPAAPAHGMREADRATTSSRSRPGIVRLWIARPGEGDRHRADVQLRPCSDRRLGRSTRRVDSVDSRVRVSRKKRC
jgi:hypothetical protein